MSDFWKNVGKKNVKVFDEEQEIRRKKEEEERKKREMANKPGLFDKLRGMVSSDKSKEIPKSKDKRNLWEQTGRK